LGKAFDLPAADGNGTIKGCFVTMRQLDPNSSTTSDPTGTLADFGVYCQFVRCHIYDSYSSSDVRVGLSEVRFIGKMIKTGGWITRELTSSEATYTPMPFRDPNGARRGYFILDLGATRNVAFLRFYHLLSSTSSFSTLGRFQPKDIAITITPTLVNAQEFTVPPSSLAGNVVTAGDGVTKLFGAQLPINLGVGQDLVGTTVYCWGSNFAGRYLRVDIINGWDSANPRVGFAQVEVYASSTNTGGNNEPLYYQASQSNLTSLTTQKGGQTSVKFRVVDALTGTVLDPTVEWGARLSIKGGNQN
jgi:hypothetical protein